MQYFEKKNLLINPKISHLQGYPQMKRISLNIYISKPKTTKKGYNLTYVSSKDMLPAFTSIEYIKSQNAKCKTLSDNNARRVLHNFGSGLNVVLKRGKECRYKAFRYFVNYRL